MLKKILFFLISINGMLMVHAGQVHVIVRSWNAQTGESSILLRRPNKDDIWSSFKEEVKVHETTFDAAARAVTQQTNGVYGITADDLQKHVGSHYYLDEEKDDIYYVLQSAFIKGSDLFADPNNVNKDDFAWIPLSKFISGQQILHPRTNKPLYLDVHITPIAERIHIHEQGKSV